MNDDIHLVYIPPSFLNSTYFLLLLSKNLSPWMQHFLLISCNKNQNFMLTSALSISIWTDNRMFHMILQEQNIFQ